MKKFWRITVVALVLLICSAAVLFSKIDDTYADYTSISGAQFILTGFSGKNPTDYFKDKQNNSRLVNAEAKQPSKNYIRANGKISNPAGSTKDGNQEYNIIDVTNNSNSGSGGVEPGVEMMEVLRSGQLDAKISCGLLAKSSQNKNMTVYLKFYAGAQVIKTIQISSSKVNVASNTYYEPDWISSEYVSVPSNTDRVMFEFSNISKCFIFEPTITFATNLTELQMITEDASIKTGDVIEIEASNIFTNMDPSNVYASHYQELHNIKYKITEGSDYAFILGSFLYVNKNAPTGASIKVAAYCRQKSSDTASNISILTSDEVHFVVGGTLYNLKVQKDFENPAIITGEGNYFIDDWATLKVEPKNGFRFVGWQIGDVEKTEKEILIQVKEQTIKAKFVKDVSIAKVNIKNKTYDGTVSAEIQSIDLLGLESGHDVKVAGATAEFVTSAAGQNREAKMLGSYSLEGRDAGIYNLVNTLLPTIKANITPKPITIVAANASKVYGDHDPTLDFESTGLVGMEMLSGDLSRVAGENVGSYAINIGTLQQQNPNYDISFVEATFTITKRPIEIKQINVQDKTYDKTTSATVSVISTGIVSQEVSLKVDASFDNYSVGQSKNVNISQISIIGENGKNYYLINSISQVKGNIVPKVINIDVNNQTTVYGEDYTIAYTTSGLVESDVLSGKLSTIDGKNAGTHLITIGTLFNSNYTLKLKEAYLRIDKRDAYVVAERVVKIYGEADPRLVYNCSNLVFGDSLTGSPSRENGENVGEYDILCGNLSNPNYNIIFSSSKFVIEKRQLLISFDIDSKVYDGNVDCNYSYNITNLVSGDTVEFDGVLEYEDKNVAENVNIVVKNAKLTGNKSNNYDFSINFSELHSSITAKKVYVSTSNYQKTFGESDPLISHTSEGEVDGENIIGNLVRESGENAGEYQILISSSMAEANKNYDLVLKDDYYLTIIPKDITISVHSGVKYFGDEDPEIDIEIISGQLCFGHKISDVVEGSVSRKSGEEVGIYEYQQGSLSFGSNYSLNIGTLGTLTIEKRPIKITVNNVEKTYGDSDPEFNYESQDIIDGTPAIISLKRQSGEAVAKYIITYDSLDDSHYVIDFKFGYLTINPKEITIKPEQSFKLYGQSDPQTNFFLMSGTLAFDDELEDLISGRVDREQGEDVGDYVVTQGSVTSNKNYSLTFENGIFSILPQQLEIKLCDVSKQYGEEDPNLTYEIIEGKLISSDDILGQAQRVCGEDIGQYAISAGTIVATSNYYLVVIEGVFTIEKRQIEITANVEHKTYGSPDPAFGYQITKGSLAEDGDLSGALFRQNIGGIYENVGNYPIICGFYNPNYEISYVGADLIIDKREIQITANSYETVYGEKVLETFDYKMRGEILDGDQITGTLYKVAGSDVGVYDIRSSLSLGRNYKINFTKGTYTILPRQIVVTVQNVQKVYGAGDPQYSIEVVEGQTVDDDVLDFFVERQEGENVGQYALTVVSKNPNYHFTTQNSSLTIIKKVAYLHVELQDKPFDGNDTCLIKTPIVSGLVDNEIIIEYDRLNCAKFKSVGPGEDIPVTLSGFRLVGKNADNYILEIPQNSKANITYDCISSGQLTISTHLSTSIACGTTLSVDDAQTDLGSDKKRVVKSLKISFVDKDNQQVVPDRPLTVSIKIEDIKNYNNFEIFNIDENGKAMAMEYRVEGDELVFETTNFNQVVVLCDDETWIDIALVVSFAVLLSIALGLGMIKIKRKKK